MGEGSGSEIFKKPEKVKTYFADTNLYLRFVLQDNKSHFKKASQFFKKAQGKRIKIIFPSVVILEIAFVLKSVYSLKKSQVTRALFGLVKTEFLEVEDRSVWLEALERYQSDNVSILDIFLFYKARSEQAEVLSFDRDFEKLKKGS